MIADDTIFDNDYFIYFCKDNNIVTKRNKVNPRKDKYCQSCIFLEKFFDAPLKVAVDIIFSYEGVIPNCWYCGKKLDLNNLTNYKPINYSHKECAKKARNESIDWDSAVEKRKAKCLSKYGTEHYFDYQSMVIDARNTKKERYGDENYVNPEKCKQTKKERYGDENYNNREKASETSFERYGASNPFGAKEIIDKATESLNLNHGGRGFASESISRKIRNTTLKDFGFVNAMQNQTISLRSSSNKRKLYYGDQLFESITEGIDEIYSEYVENDGMSVNKLSKKIGISKKALLDSFKKNGFEILDRTYSCNTSQGEQTLIDIITEINHDVNIVRNTRKIIAPKEIDIWLPDYNIGFEYHGSYWHQKDKVGDLHRIKADLSNKAGIKLFQFFDYEVSNKYEAVKSIVMSALDLSSTIVSSSDCIVTVLDHEGAKDFYLKNSLLEYQEADIEYGLIHKDYGLAQVISLKQTDHLKWKIVGHCSKLYHRILDNGFILRDFLKRFSPETVMINIDARIPLDDYIPNKKMFLFRSHTESNLIIHHRSLVENQKMINKTEKYGNEILDAGGYLYSWELKN